MTAVGSYSVGSGMVGARISLDGDKPAQFPSMAAAQSAVTDVGIALAQALTARGSGRYTAEFRSGGREGGTAIAHVQITPNDKNGKPIDFEVVVTSDPSSIPLYAAAI